VLSTHARDDVVKRESGPAETEASNSIKETSENLLSKVKVGLGELHTKFDKFWVKVKSFGSKAKDVVEQKMEDAVDKVKEIVHKKD
jgi:hypothetical protein